MPCCNEVSMKGSHYSTLINTVRATHPLSCFCAASVISLLGKYQLNLNWDAHRTAPPICRRHSSYLGCDWLPDELQCCERHPTRSARRVCVWAERVHWAELNQNGLRQWDWRLEEKEKEEGDKEASTSAFERRQFTFFWTLRSILFIIYLNPWTDSVILRFIFCLAPVCSFYAFACTRADLWPSRPEEHNTAERRRRRHGETEGLLPGPKHPLPLWRGRYFDTTERGEYTSNQSIIADTSDAIGYWLFHWCPLLLRRPCSARSSGLSNPRLLSGWQRAAVRAHRVPLTSYTVLMFVGYFPLLLVFTRTVLQRHMGEGRGGEERGAVWYVTWECRGGSGGATGASA